MPLSGFARLTTTMLWTSTILMIFLDKSLPDACRSSTYLAGHIPPLIQISAVIGAFYAVLAMIFGFAWVGEPGGQHRVAKATLLGIWVIATPLLLFLEYEFYWMPHGRLECFEAFQYGQELASRFWASIATVLGFLFFGKEVFGR